MIPTYGHFDANNKTRVSTYSNHVLGSGSW